MKILLDENISWRLVKKLALVFPEIIHSSSLPINQPVKDIEIWNFAKQNGYTIITKDDDFEKFVLLKKSPPKVIHLKTFNLDTNKIERLLIENKDKITAFCSSTEDEIMEIYSK